MRGLPFQATVEDVKEFYKGYRVEKNGIFITMGADGRATGEAYVVFEDEEEASKAREALNKQSIMSRWIELYAATKGGYVCMCVCVCVSPFPRIIFLKPKAHFVIHLSTPTHTYTHTQAMSTVAPSTLR